MFLTFFITTIKAVHVYSDVLRASIATAEIPLRPPGFATNRVKVYLDSPRFPGWNEIDAVGLVGPGDRVQWAVGAEASSTFASTRAGLSLSGGGAPALAPSWGGLHAATDDFTNFRVRREERALDARGWPMLSLWGEVPTARVARQTTGGGAGGGAMSVTFTSGFLLAGTTAAPGPAAGEPPLLIHPIWRGFLFNSAFYAVAVACAFWLLTGPRRFVRELARMRRGRCIACGYDLNFNFVPGCPECGWRRSTARIPPTPGS